MAMTVTVYTVPGKYRESAEMMHRICAGGPKDYTVLIAVRDVICMRSWILGNGTFTGEELAKAIKDFYAPSPRRDFDVAVCSWIARIERSFFETQRTTLVMKPSLLALLKIEDYGRVWIAKGDD